MKKLLLAIVAIAFISLPFSLKAQDKKEEKKEISEKIEKKEKVEKKEKIEKKETQEIVIRNKGSKDLNLKVEINGDKITVNGKPLEEFKDEQVTINNRKMFITERDGEVGFNFAPFNKNFNMTNDFKGTWKGKEMSRPFLGVTTEEVEQGAKITEVIKGSAAEKAGLKKDDIITKIGDETISDGDNLADVISAKKPKEVVNVSYIRNGKASNVKAPLGERKLNAASTYAYSYPRGKVRSFSLDKLSPNVDLAFSDKLDNLENWAPNVEFGGGPFIHLDNSFARQKRLGLKIQDTEEGGNVKIIEVEEGSAAEKAGLKKDDIITEIGGEKIESTDDAREQLMPSEAKTSYTIKAKRSGAEMTFEVKFPKKLKTANL